MRKIIPLILSLFMILMLTACSGNSNEPSTGGNTQTSSSGQTNKSESNTGSVQSSSTNNSTSGTSDTSTKPASSSGNSVSSSNSSTKPASSSGNSVSSSNSSTEPASPPGSSVSASSSSTKPVSSDSTSSMQSSSNDNSTSKTPSNTSSDERPAQPEETGKKVLVAYFSATGTTKALAEYAADAVNGDLYEIVPKEPYSSADLDYGDRSSRSSKEMDDPSCRPAINGKVSDMSQYDIVFIGYPIWWGEAPRIVSTFIESYDFSGKTIVPFCTSGGSGMGSSAKNLHSLASSSKWLDGARLKSKSSRGDMVSWINGLGLDIKAE